MELEESRDFSFLLLFDPLEFFIFAEFVSFVIPQKSELDFIKSKIGLYSNDVMFRRKLFEQNSRIQFSFEVNVGIFQQHSEMIVWNVCKHAKHIFRNILQWFYGSWTILKSPTRKSRWNFYRKMKAQQSSTLKGYIFHFHQSSMGLACITTWYIMLRVAKLKFSATV